jgi:threonine dehydrogenase-like Zn-dependent dehydrogenase
MCPNRISTAAGFADYQLVPGSVVFKLPLGLEPELGALAEPLSCAMHAVDRAGIRPADSVAIVGAGALGLLVLQVARLSGATKIIVSEPDPGRRALAESLGATRTVDPTSTDPVEVIRAETAGRGVECAFEAVGSVRTIEQAFRLPRQGGTLIQVSVPPTTARLDLPAYELFARELTIRGSFIRTTEFRRAVELLGVLDLRPLITERFALSQAPAAIEAARQRQGVRVLVGGEEGWQ